MVRRRTLEVGPARSGGWAVIVSGRRVDTQPTKRDAVDAARRRGSKGDVLRVKNADGTFQNTVTLRG